MPAGAILPPRLGLGLLAREGGAAHDVAQGGQAQLVARELHQFDGAGQELVQRVLPEDVFTAAACFLGRLQGGDDFFKESYDIDGESSALPKRGRTPNPEN